MQSIIGTRQIPFHFRSNMDEFFMVRVSGIRKQVEHHIMEISPDDLTRLRFWQRRVSYRLNYTNRACIISIKNPAPS